ncbi:MAG TPA: thioredoxin family protein, partial [Patescibacteria group bacterium]
KIQQLFGIVMILAALAIFTNYDQKFQLALLNQFPALGIAVNGFENSRLVTNQLELLKGTKITKETPGLFNSNIMAPDFTGVTKWLNTDKSVYLKDLKGKVVLVDFWTYTCINCIRTLPHVTSWYEKYKDQGFVVVGVHTPEFQFEHDTGNVLQAIKMFNIHYPVAQDNDYATWNNYSNQYWPAEYLIDAKGVIRRTHFGEDEYPEMEQAIQLLLKDAGHKITKSLDTMPDQTPKIQLSPETYLGAKRMEFYYPSGNPGAGKHTFVLDDTLSLNSFSLGGEWEIADENALTSDNSVLNYNFYADKVFLVLRPGKVLNTKVKVFLDGKSVDVTNSGADVINGVVTIDSDRLYNLINLKGVAGNHLLRLEFQNSGIEVFAFTFG